MLEISTISAFLALVFPNKPISSTTATQQISIRLISPVETQSNEQLLLVDESYLHTMDEPFRKKASGFVTLSADKSFEIYVDVEGLPKGYKLSIAIDSDKQNAGQDHNPDIKQEILNGMIAENIFDMTLDHPAIDGAPVTYTLSSPIGNDINPLPPITVTYVLTP